MADIPNIGWKYTYEYYKDIDFSYLRNDIQERRKMELVAKASESFKARNQALFGCQFESYADTCNLFPKLPGFKLATTYPGLLAGSGYQHEVKVEGELKLGFSFDHTTGLPIIPGSSIKGVLRSKWPIKNEDNSTDARKDFREFILWVMCRVNELIEKPIKSESERALAANVELIDLNKFSPDSNAIDLLELEIFEGVDVQKTSPGKLVSTKFKKDWVYLKPSAKDVFYDAAIVEAQGNFLSNDYITPHINREKPELSPFSNPTPLQFMKVLPEVQFRFSFDVKDSPSGLLSSAQKLLLFRQLLLTLGIGAKTNVGYGHFQELEENSDQKKSVSNKQHAQKRDGNSTKQVEGQPTIGQQLTGEIINSYGSFIKVRFVIAGITFEKQLPKGGKIGSIVKLRITNIRGRIDRGNLDVDVARI